MTHGGENQSVSKDFIGTKSSESTPEPLRRYVEPVETSSTSKKESQAKSI